MITYDVNLCIGMAEHDKGVVVKCHDTGVNLRVWLSVLCQKTWRAETEPYIIPDGTTAVLKIAKPDKTFVLVDGVITGGYILFDLRETPQAFTAAGSSGAEVSLFDANGRRLTTASFEIEVPKECVCDCKEESKSYVDIMAKQIGAAIDAEANAKSAAGRAEDAAERAENAAASIDDDAIKYTINAALKEAKESGEFDGKDGENGKDAEVTAQNIESALGYAPVSAKDGADGQFAISDGNGGLIWLSKADVALMITEIQSDTRLDTAVLDVMRLGD